MTDEEIAQLLVGLEQLLRELGLDFIVTQERVLAAEGVSQSPASPTSGRGDEAIGERYLEETFPRDVATPRQRESWPVYEILSEGGPEPRFRKGDIVVRPLDVRDRLAILLDLMEVATAGTVAMERDLQNQLKELRRLAVDHAASESVRRTAALDWAETWDGTVTFASPPEAELRGDASRPWQLRTGDGLRSSLASAHQVVGLLDSLRTIAGVPRGRWLMPFGAGPVEQDIWGSAEETS